MGTSSFLVYAFAVVAVVLWTPLSGWLHGVGRYLPSMCVGSYLHTVVCTAEDPLVSAAYDFVEVILDGK